MKTKTYPDPKPYPEKVRLVILDLDAFLYPYDKAYRKAVLRAWRVIGRAAVPRPAIGWPLADPAFARRCRGRRRLKCCIIQQCRLAAENAHNFGIDTSWPTLRSSGRKNCLRLQAGQVPIRP